MDTHRLKQRLSIGLRHLGRFAARPYPIDYTSAQQRQGMAMLWWDTLLSSLSGAFYGEFEVLYLLALGATSAVVATRASLASMFALLAPILGAWLVTRTGKRKLWILWSAGGVSRFGLVLAMLTPFFFDPPHAIYVLLALAALMAFSNSLAGPPFGALLADLIPIRIRGRYLSTRMMASSLIRAAAVPLAGQIIQRIGGIGGYQVAWGIAAATGFAATSFFARIPEPESAEKRAGHEEEGFRKGLRELSHDRLFMSYCLVSFVWTLGIQLSAPFFSVHMVQTLGFSVQTISLLSMTATIVSFFGVRVAGILVDRKGPGLINAIGMLLVPLMPIAWVFARTPFQVALARSYGVLAWAGVQVASTPLVLRMTPAKYRSQFIAILSTINGLAAIIGPQPAAWIYARWGFTVNLIVSAIGRGLGALLFLLLYLRYESLREPTSDELSPSA